MNTRMIGFLLGRILMVEAGLLALPLDRKSTRLNSSHAT